MRGLPRRLVEGLIMTQFLEEGRKEPTGMHALRALARHLLPRSARPLEFARLLFFTSLFVGMAAIAFLYASIPLPLGEEPSAWYWAGWWFFYGPVLLVGLWGVPLTFIWWIGLAWALARMIWRVGEVVSASA